MNWILDRPLTYDSSLIYDELTQTWISKDGRGGSRFQNRVLVINDTGLIFVSEL